MLRKGQKVMLPTKKVGQAPRVGRVVEVRGEMVEVRWDDGRVSSVIGGFLQPVKAAAAKH